MKKLFILLLFVPLVSFGQNQTTVVGVKSNTNIVELAEKRAASLTLTSENKLNLDDVKGFVLVNISAQEPGAGWGVYLRNKIRTALEYSPFEVIYKKKDIKKLGLKAGYIYVTYNRVRVDNNNFTSSGVFRNYNKRTVLSFSVVNKTIEEVFNELGISSY